MSDVNLGNISIPVIAPQRGVDYWTEEDKQEVITEAVNSVNAIVVPQEESRQSNEATRVLNEEGRVNAEATRQSNEQIRINNENTRQSNEDTRQLNEQARINAETVRQSNEQTRQTNETNRTNTFNEQMNSIDRAIEGVLKGVTVTPTEPTGNNKSLVWFQKGTNIENKIHVKNDNDEYEIFANTGAFEKEVTDARGTFNNLDSRIDSIETEVTNARGSFSSLDDRLDDIETEIAEDTITGEGENITLNGTAQNAMKKLVIKGKTEQEQLTGKNLFNVNGNVNLRGNDEQVSSANTVSNGVLTTVANTASTNAVGQKITGLNGKQITFSADIVSVGTGEYAGLYIYDNHVLKSYNTFSVGTKATLTYTCTSDNIIFAFATKNGTGAQYKNIQVELGSTATSYEPYCGGIPSPNPNFPQTIHNVSGELNDKIQNKNLFDKTKVTYNYYLNTQGTLDSASNYCVSDYINIQEGKSYYISTRGTNRTKFYDQNKQPLTSSYDVLNTDTNFTAPINAKYIRTSIAYTTISLDTFIIGEGTTEINYVPHQEQNLPFTFSSGQVLMQDGMLTDSGVYNENIKVILTGTETWYTTGATDNTALHYFTLSETAKSDWIKCTVCPYDNLAFSSDTIGGYINTSNNRLLIRDTHLTNSDWKTYLAEQYANGTPVIVEYKLATPTTTAYTSTQQLQYNAIKNAISYNEQTNISSTSTDLSADLEAEAFERMSNQNYVTQEIPIGMWQGKTLYRKVIDFGALPNNTTKEVYHGIADIDYIKSCTGYAMTTDGSGLMLPSYNGTIVTNLYANRLKIGVYTSGDRSSFTTCYITIEYTKA